jgi:hypothetical protein
LKVNKKFIFEKKHATLNGKGAVLSSLVIHRTKNIEEEKPIL